MDKDTKDKKYTRRIHQIGVRVKDNDTNIYCTEENKVRRIKNRCGKRALKFEKVNNKDDKELVTECRKKTNK